MGLPALRSWFRSGVEEKLLMALAIPLHLVQPVEQVVEILISEARGLGFGYVNKLLMIRAALIMREQVSRAVKGGLASMIEAMLNAERLGVDPSVSVLYVLRDLDDHLRALGNNYRDLAMLLDVLIMLTLALVPMIIALVSQALGIDPLPYLVINYATAAPLALLLGWNLDPGLLTVDNNVVRGLGASIIPLALTYLLTRSIAAAWLAMAVVFLALTIRWYAGYVASVNTLGMRAVEAVMRASTTQGARWVVGSRNWFEDFVNEYARVIALTGMGRPDVLAVAVTAITHVVNTLLNSRRVATISIVVSISFIVILLAIARFVVSQLMGGSAIMALLLPTAILGSFFCGYVLDSFITGIYATIPTVITYLALTIH